MGEFVVRLREGSSPIVQCVGVCCNLSSLCSIPPICIVLYSVYSVQHLNCTIVWTNASLNFQFLFESGTRVERVADQKGRRQTHLYTVQLHCTHFYTVQLAVPILYMPIKVYCKIATKLSAHSHTRTEVGKYRR